ncbi:hypothetical protein [Haladaptatus caseinilyticus]|uniref:hypothetical protein n=1 Tax=Haladaptatus caseinilyticus TaxID=2993314 RepID=UPI00224B2F3C|nr:hypothetical protein [Haladaptatus caseinilyticus]
MEGEQSVDMERLLSNSKNQPWLFAQVCLLKQQVKEQRSRIDHLERALEELVDKTSGETTLCGDCSRCGGILLEERDRLVCTDCGDVRYL